MGGQAGGAARWRAMAAADLAAAERIAARVHPDYPEDAAVFAERLSLFPEGCLVLVSPSGELGGYVIAHPWRLGQPPALNSLLGALPAAADTLYIHDIALLPERRGGGAAGRALERLRRWRGGAGCRGCRSWRSAGRPPSGSARASGSGRTRRCAGSCGAMAGRRGTW